MTYSVDPHTTPAGSVCPLGSADLDPDASAPSCACGASVTAEGGLDPRRLVPHALSSRAVLVPLAVPITSPQRPDVVVLGSMVDQWGHSALVLQWHSTPMMVGPGYTEAMRTIGQLTRVVPELREWLVEMWTAQCSERARLEQLAHERRRAARQARTQAHQTHDRHALLSA